MIKMDIENISEKILMELKNKSLTFKELHGKLSDSSIDLLKMLERIGFIGREGADSLISSCNWRITKQGDSFLQFKKTAIDNQNKLYKIVMTLPPIFKKSILEKHPEIELTELCIRELFSRANKEIKILSPYVDASVINYLKDVKPYVNIKFLTVPSKYGKNPILERLKQTMKNLEIKYLYQFDKEIQQFQIHAKIIISDINSMYIGSANFKDTSILYNLESGLLIKDEKMIKEHSAVYDEIYNSLK